MDFHTDLPLRLMFRTAHTHTAPIEPQQITIHTTSTGYGGKPMGNAFGHPHPRPGRVEGCVQVRCWEPAPLAADLERLGAAEPTRGLRQLVQALRPDVQAAFLRYRPLELSSERWEKARPLAEDAVALIAPACRYLAARLLVVVTPFVDWMITVNGYPPYPRTLFHPAMIRRYIHDPNLPLKDATRRDYRSLLLRISEVILPEQDALPFTALNGQQRSTPLTDLELQLLTAWAHGQSTTGRRRDAAAILALAAGAGLDPWEIQHLRTSDIHTGPHGILITVPGRHPRQVPLLQQWEPLLHDAIHDAPHDTWVFGSPTRRPESTNSVTTFIRGSQTSTSTRPSPNRMRATWLITHLAAQTPITPLMTAAGLSKIDHPLRMLVHIPALDTTSHRLALRAAHRTEKALALSHAISGEAESM